MIDTDQISFRNSKLLAMRSPARPCVVLPAYSAGASASPTLSSSGVSNTTGTANDNTRDRRLAQ